MKHLLYLFLLLPLWVSAQPGPVSGGNSEQLYNLWNTLGWVRYKDDAYTEVAPFSVSLGDTATLFNNAANVIDNYIPNDLDSLWNRTDSTIMAQKIGDAYLVRIDFTAKSSQSEGYGTLSLDIGGAIGPIVNRLFTFPRGADIPHKFSITTLLYSLDTFIANGAKIKISSGRGDLSLYDVNFVFSRVFHAP